MLNHPQNYLEKLSPAQVEEILTASLWVLEKTGLRVQDEPLWAEVLEKAGPGVMAGPDQRLRLKPEKALELIALAPSEWRHEARRPENSRMLGGRRLCVVSGACGVFIVDWAGRRRYAGFEDFLRLTRLTQASPVMDICAHIPIEPSDVPVEYRPEVMTAGLLLSSDKPIMGMVTGAKAAAASLEAAEIILGDLSRAFWVLGLISINSPLLLEARMAEATRIYLQRGQPLLFASGTTMGVLGPVTLAGSLAQSFAELIGVVAMCQLIRPGHPVMIGNGGFCGNLRTGSTGYGRPEQALGFILGAQMARRLKLPYRCTAGATASPAPDIQAALEHTFTALGAWVAGPNFVFQGAGVIDSINSMSYEQFVLDLEMWSYIQRLTRPVEIDDEHLPLDLIAQAPPSYLGHQHTLKHFRRELYEPIFGKRRKQGDMTVEEVAKERLAKIETETREITPIDPTAAAELKKYLAARQVPADFLEQHF